MTPAPSPELLAFARALGADNVHTGDNVTRGLCARLMLEALSLGAAGRARLGLALIEGTVDALRRTQTSDIEAVCGVEPAEATP